MADAWEGFLSRYAPGARSAQSRSPSLLGNRMSSYRDAIAAIESRGSGDYSAVGPRNSRLGRALGRYQIMEANIPQWSRQALGREVSVDEFMANPDIQDVIFDNVFGGYVQRYGEEGAAQAWFGGPGSVGRTERRDVLGTSVGGYGQRFLSNLSQGQQSPRARPGFSRLWLDLAG